MPPSSLSAKAHRSAIQARIPNICSYFNGRVSTKTTRSGSNLGPTVVTKTRGGTVHDVPARAAAKKPASRAKRPAPAAAAVLAGPGPGSVGRRTDHPRRPGGVGALGPAARPRRPRHRHRVGAGRRLGPRPASRWWPSAPASRSSGTAAAGPSVDRRRGRRSGPGHRPVAPRGGDAARPARHLRPGRAGQGHAAAVGLALLARRRRLRRRGRRASAPRRPGDGRRRRPARGRRARGDPHRHERPLASAAGAGRGGGGRRAQRRRAVGGQAPRDRPGRRRRRGERVRLVRPRFPIVPEDGTSPDEPPPRRERRGHRHPARSRAR